MQPVAEPSDYHAWLAPLAETDIWTTTYLHVLEGEDPVIEWMKGTGLRPYLQGLPDEAEREAFLAAYRLRIEADFPKTAEGATPPAVPAPVHRGPPPLTPPRTPSLTVRPMWRFISSGSARGRQRSISGVFSSPRAAVMAS